MGSVCVFLFFFSFKLSDHFLCRQTERTMCVLRQREGEKERATERATEAQ